MTSSHPLMDPLQVHISAQRLRVVPSGLSGLQVNGANSQAQQVDNPVEERSFEVEVVNQSDRFASFEIELSTPGQPPIAANHWYDVEPKVCAKKPPGDRTNFRVIINRPPIPAIDTTLDLTVHIFSVEYDDLETEHHLDLVIEQRSQPLQVHLVSPYFKAYPGDRLTIEALAMNLQSEPADITLRLLRLNPDWFLSSTPNDLGDGDPATILRQTLPGGDTRRVAFHCIPPTQPLTASDSYEFDVEISDRSNFSTTHGQIEILPAGPVLFHCPPRLESIPASGRRWGFSKNQAIFQLPF